MSFRKIWAQQQILKYLKICITVCVLPSAQQYVLNRKLNNDIGKKIDFSSSVAPAERAARMARVSLLGEATPLRPHPALLQLLGGRQSPTGAACPPSVPGQVMLHNWRSSGAPHPATSPRCHPATASA